MKKVESTVSDNEVKVSDEQLSQLQKFDSDFNQIKLNLGHLELSKANLIDFNKEIQTKLMKSLLLTPLKSLLKVICRI